MEEENEDTLFTQETVDRNQRILEDYILPAILGGQVGINIGKTGAKLTKKVWNYLYPKSTVARKPKVATPSYTRRMHAEDLKNVPLQTRGQGWVRPNPKGLPKGRGLRSGGQPGEYPPDSSYPRSRSITKGGGHPKSYTKEEIDLLNVILKVLMK